jgi:GTP-binding protein YchF
MKMGILGFSGSGKTTVFNLLTGLSATVGPGGDRKPNIGVIKVPDARIDTLSAMYKPKKTVFAEMSFVDVAGKAPDGSGTALDVGLLSHVRDTDAFTLVVRAFDSMMLEDASNPTAELQNLDSELIINDLGVAEKRLERLAKESKASELEGQLLVMCIAHLEAEKPLRTLELSGEQELALRGFRFLSQKPALVLVNTGDGSDAIPKEVNDYAAGSGMDALNLCAAIEAELAELDPDDQALFLAEYGIEAPGRDRFIRAAYHKLDLISFFTTGEDEVRAWTITRGTPAVKAGGKIHTDIEKGFIRAEVTPYAALIELGSEQAVKAAGKMGLEGKEYVVQDGDICHYRFNV